MSKRVLLGLGIVVVLALLGAAGLQAVGAERPASVSAQATAAPAAAQTSLPRSITVVGRGSVSVKPDIATISVGVQSDAATVKEATTDVATKMTAILAALKTQGVADKDIQTNNYSISYETRQPVDVATTTKAQTPVAPTGIYHVSNMVMVKVRDTSKVTALVDALVNAGANNLWGINFTLEDSTKSEADARAKSVADAKSRAEEFAKLAGVKVGPVVSVSEVITGSPLVASYALDSAKFGMGGGGPGAVSPGEVEVSVQVQVVYAIE
jgi:uncharacterized protein